MGVENSYYKDKLKANQGNPKSHLQSISNILGRNFHTSNQNLVEFEPPCNNISDKFNTQFLGFENSLTRNTSDNRNLA